MRIGGIKLPKNQSDVEIKKKGNSVEVIDSGDSNFDNGNITQEILRFTFDSLSYYDFKRSDKYYQKKGEELMAMHQAFYKQIDPIQIVLRGAILKCTHSSDDTYIKLDTLEDFGVYSHKHSVMTCTDCKASENIFNFGLCGNSVYNPVYGKDLPSPTETGEDKKGNCRHVCFPILADEWVIGARDGSSSIYIDKETCEIEQFEEALLTNASLLCYYGGIITIEQNPEDEIEEEIKEERRDALMQLQQEIVFERTENMIGKVLEVFIEGKLTDENVYIGRSYMDAPNVDGYVFVNTSQELLSGDFVKVKITGALDYDMTGELLDEFTE